MQRKIGGGLLVAVSVAVPLVVSKMSIELSAEQGIALLAICAIVAVIGLFLAFWPAKVAKPSLPERSSTTAKASGGGIIELEEYTSTADTLLHAEDTSRITAKRGTHNPAAGASGRPTDARSKGTGSTGEDANGDVD